MRWELRYPGLNELEVLYSATRSPPRPDGLRSIAGMLKGKCAPAGCETHAKYCLQSAVRIERLAFVAAGDRLSSTSTMATLASKAQGYNFLP